VYENILPI